tara:strand:- start:4213 stop:4362 length:150 start_codon:yes stop_codon:yes gene_type:complete
MKAFEKHFLRNIENKKVQLKKAKDRVEKYEVQIKEAEDFLQLAKEGRGL